MIEKLPDILYVSDASNEYDRAGDDPRFFAVSEDRNDLTVYEEETIIGIYKLVAVQAVEKGTHVKVNGTELAAEGSVELDLDVGKGGVSVSDVG